MGVGLLLVLVGCGGGKDSEDADQDGVPVSQDCNDDDASVFPGADERCDGIDQNCDGQIDEGVTTRFFADADGDGFGDPLVPQEACEAPDGFVADASDCDDEADDVNPDAPEECDEVDHNCDGDPTFGAADEATWYADNDGDGYGADDIAVSQCEPIDGYVTTGGDCNDADASINPEGTETCNGADDDCNGTVDDNVPTPPTWYVDGDGDGYGDDASGVAACDAPTGTIAVGGDCDDVDPDVNPGATEVCNGGVDDDCDPATDEDTVAGDEWYTDADDDGHGIDDGSSVFACVEPPFTAAVADDCDDTNPAINPDADEVCGGGDEDCSGAVDDDPVDGTPYYADGDNDGFGAAPLGNYCTDPGTGVDLPGDCDDTDPAINPAASELCNGGIDDDCDPLTTDDDSAEADTFYADLDADTFGDPTNPVRACVQPADAVQNTDDCDDTDPNINPLATEICDGGVDNDCDPATDEDDTVTWYEDSDSDDWGKDAVTATGCTQPPGYAADPGDCDDADPTVNPGLYPDCEAEHCGVIAVDETWKASLTHVVTCDVDVQGVGSPTLIIEDGVTVTVQAGHQIRVGTSDPGRLQALGTVLGIDFTSARVTPSTGDWESLVFGPRDQGSVLDNVMVAYAGSAGVAGIEIDDASPVLTRLEVRDNAGHGIAVTGGAPEIRDSTLVDNVQNGIDIASGAGLATGLDDTFSGNTVTGNGARPVVLPAGAVDELDDSSTYAGNGTDEIEVLGDTVTQSATWELLDVGHRVTGDLEVEGPANPVLVLSDGLVLAFESGSEMAVGRTVPGTLVIDDQGVGVELTSARNSPAPGDWGGLELGPGADGSVLDGLTVAWGGATGSGGIVVDEADVRLSSVTSRSNQGAGVYVTTATVEIVNSTITDNTGEGVFLDANAALAAADPLTRTFAGNVVTQNLGAPLDLSVQSVDELDGSNTMSPNGDEHIRLRGGTTAVPTTVLDLGVPYELYGADWRVEAAAGPFLTLDDGVEVQFEAGRAFEVAVSAPAALLVNGFVDGVLFTSAEAAPAAGDWDGVRIGDLDLGSVLEGLTIRYGGGNGRGGLWADGSSPTVLGGALLDNAGAGFYGVGSEATLDGVEIRRNSGTGVVFDDQSTPADLSGNTIAGNGGSAVQLAAGDAGTLDPAGSYAGNGVDEIVLLGDTITTGVTWPFLGVPYRVETGDDVRVEGGPAAVLTVADGVVVQWSTNSELAVGEGAGGRLDVQGAGVGVRFTSAAAAPLPGDWDGVFFGELDTGSTITGLDIAYGGGNGKGNLAVDASSPTFTDVGSTSSDTNGLWLEDGADVEVTGSTFADNDDSGLQAALGTGLSVYTGNTHVANGGFAVSVPAEVVGVLDNTSTFAGNGGPIEVLGGSVLTSQTWVDLDAVLQVAGDIDVDGPLDPVLTLGSGLIMLFDDATALSVGDGDDGGLEVDGVATPVVMTSSRAVPAAGAWDGLIVGSRFLGGRVEGLEIRYAGGAAAGDGGNIEVLGALGLELVDVLSERSSKSGIYGTQSASIVVSDSSIVDNTDSGIVLVNGARIETFQNNVVTTSGSYSVEAEADSMGNLDTTSTFGDPVLIDGGTVATDATWVDLGVPFEVIATVSVGGATAPHLHIDEGTVMRMGPGTELRVAASDPGSLSAGVAGGAPTVFTSSQAAPAAGDWLGIELLQNCVAAATLLEDVVVEYSGGNLEAAVVFDRCDGSILDSVVSHSASGGVLAKGGALPTVSGNTYFNNVGPDESL